MRPAPVTRIAVLTDLHVAEAGTPDSRWIGTLPLGRSRDLLGESARLVAGLAPDGVVLLGDLTQDGTDAQLDLLAGELPALGRPVWAVPGNHDLGEVADPLRRLDGAVTVPDPVGSGWRGLHVATGRLARVPGGAGQTGWGEYREGAAPEVGGWPADRPVFWLTHFPVIGLRAEVTAGGLPYAGDLTDREGVLAALARHPGPVVVLAGHLHLRATAVRGSVLQLSHPALIEPPHQVTLLEVDPGLAGDGIRVARRCLGLTDGPGPGLVPRQEAWTYRGGEWRPDLVAGGQAEAESPGPASGDPRSPSPSR